MSGAWWTPSTGLTVEHAVSAPPSSHMKPDDLTLRLERLDPGSVLVIDLPELARVLGMEVDDPRLLETAQSLALRHRCNFATRGSSLEGTFEKDDVF